MKHSKPKSQDQNNQPVKAEVITKSVPSTTPTESSPPAVETKKVEVTPVEVSAPKKAKPSVDTVPKDAPAKTKPEVAAKEDTTPKKAEVEEPAKEVKQAPFTALVTDDNYFNRDIFRMALEDAGFVVDEAENGKSCQTALAEKTFDLLVLDLQMPDISGLDILRDIDTKQSKGTMSILVVTANPHMVTEDVEDKADYTMQKPVDVAAFSTFVKRLIERKRR